MAQMQPERQNQTGSRRSSQQNLDTKRARRRRAGITMALAVFVVLLALLVLITPKQHLGRAAYTIGTESGLVDSSLGDESAYYKGLVISEIMSSNRTAVPDDTGAYPDWVELWNNSGHDIDLYGIGLSDSGDTIRFMFTSHTIMAADARVLVYCSGRHQSEAGKPYHAKFKLSSSGETVYLFEPSAYLIDSVTYHIMGSDTSWALQEDGSYAEVTSYSPGYPNTEEGYRAYRTATMASEGALIINEVMADPKSGLTDEDGEFVDWVELYNTTDKTIYLDNYALSDKENKPLKWRFPEGAVVPPHSYYLVYCSGKDRRNDPTAIPHTSFRISAEHDTVVLSDSRGRLVDRVVIDNVPEDCSYARNANGVFVIEQQPTPAMANTEESAWQMDRLIRQWNPTGVYITEVMASNRATAVQGATDYCDWVELYNSSAKAVNLSGYGLSDNIGRPRRWQFPEGTTIQPGQYMVILCDGNVAASTGVQLHTNFKIKRIGGETVCLSDPDGKVLDRLVLPEIPTGVSYGRTQNMTGFFYYKTPTPLAANGGESFRGYAPAPELSEAPGLHYGTAYVSLSMPEGCSVYFTTDGSTPTRDSTLYQGQVLELNFTTVIRARAFSDTGLEPSTVTTGTYFINAYHALPVVSLVCDPDELWNETDGILTAGPNVDKSVFPFANTIYRALKDSGAGTREGHVEYYLLDGTQVLNQGMEFGLQGQYSLDMPQKTFKVRARSQYGSKYFNAKLFDDREYEQYRCFVLRNSGNDCVWTRLLDGFQSRLLDAYGTQIMHQAWNPVVVYLNGVYWGHYNMRERVDRYFVAQHEGLPLEDADKITILEADGKLASGSDSVRREYANMIKKMKAGDPANNEEDLQYILDNVDVDNYLEYMALLTFVGDSDPGNIRFYRVEGEGNKWRWIWYDKDYGLFNSGFNSPKSYTKKTGMGDKNIDNTIFLKLLEVPEYKDMFLTKLGAIFKTFTTEYMLNILEPMVAQIQPEMNMHFNRWGEENDKAIISELPTTSDGAYRYWEKRVDRLRNTLKKRPNLLWGFIRDGYNLTNAEMVHYFGERPAMPDDVV